MTPMGIILAVLLTILCFVIGFIAGIVFAVVVQVRAVQKAIKDDDREALSNALVPRHISKLFEADKDKLMSEVLDRRDRGLMDKAK